MDQQWKNVKTWNIIQDACLITFNIIIFCFLIVFFSFVFVQLLAYRVVGEFICNKISVEQTNTQFHYEFSFIFLSHLIQNHQH